MQGHSLDYETPTPRGPRTVVYWTAFAVGAYAGLIFANVMDDLICLSVTGHHSDGVATILAAIGIPLAAIVAGVVREIRQPRRTPWVFASICAIAAPPLIVAILYAAF